jgi:hypothetical protein
VYQLKREFPDSGNHHQWRSIKTEAEIDLHLQHVDGGQRSAARRITTFI